MPARPIVLDANILIRFVLGEKVSALLAAYAATIDFLAPDTVFDETRRHLPEILRARGDDGTGVAAALAALDAVTAIITLVPASSYEPMRAPAMARIGQRDPHDWQVLACALLLNCPVWTEDKDFFGTGVATCLLDQAHAGEEIILAKGGKPYARLVPLERLPGKRRPGRLCGVVGPAFFEPLPDEELAGWEPR